MSIDNSTAIFSTVSAKIQPQDNSLTANTMARLSPLRTTISVKTPSMLSGEYELKHVEVNTRFDFPNIGNNRTLYIAKEESAIYRWDADELKYFCVGSAGMNVEIINGGNAYGQST